MGLSTYSNGKRTAASATPALGTNLDAAICEEIEHLVSLAMAPRVAFEAASSAVTEQDLSRMAAAFNMSEEGLLDVFNTDL